MCGLAVDSLRQFPSPETVHYRLLLNQLFRPCCPVVNGGCAIHFLLFPTKAPRVRQFFTPHHPLPILLKADDLALFCLTRAESN